MHGVASRAETTAAAMRPVIAGRRRPRTIRATLIWLVVACIVPAWIGVVAVIWSIYERERVLEGDATIGTARALALAVDRDLLSATTAAQVLAASPYIASLDLPAFYLQATVVGPSFADIIVLSEASGQQLVNTLMPYGAPLPRHGNDDQLRGVRETGEPVVSDVYVGAVARKPLVSIDIPVFRDEKVDFVLSVGMLPERLLRLLQQQRFKPTWTVAIIDRSGAIVARNRDTERFVGQKVPPALLQAIAESASGLAELPTLDGIPVFAAFSRSAVSGWTVAIGIPLAELRSGLHQFLAISGAGALVLLGLVIWLAVYQSGRIIRTVRALIAPADALGRGEAPGVPALLIREVDEVGRSLNRAFHVMRQREDERDRARHDNRVAEVFARAKDELIGTVSHELRTPLTSIAGSLGLLAANAAGPLPDTAMRLIGIAHANIQRLLRLVNDILDSERLASGEVVFQVERVDVLALVEHVIEANAGFAAGHGATLRLSAGADAVDVRADSDRLNQVLTNLMSNAIKFSPPGGEVAVGIEARGGTCRIAVRDHGAGIPDHFRSRIFEKFSQAEMADARQKGGTGLGLSIVRQIMSRLGGETGFEDAPGGGTIFWVDVPCWESSGEQPVTGGDPRLVARATPG